MAEVYERKIKQFKAELEELADEFAANDDGDIELRDVHPFVMEVIKTIKIEIESANPMADLVLNTFVKEFVESLKKQRNLKTPSALVLPTDILYSFNRFLQSNIPKRIMIIDLIPTSNAKPQQQQQEQKNKKPEQASQPPPPKNPLDVQQKQQQKEVAPALNPDDEDYGYEYIEESFEEEMEEEELEPQSDFGDVDDLIGNDASPKNKGRAKKEKQPPETDNKPGDKIPHHSKKKQKEEGEESPGKKKKKEGPPKQQKQKEKQEPEEEKKKEAPPVHPKQQLFKDEPETPQQKQQQKDATPKVHNNKVPPQIILPNESDDDKAVFNGLKNEQDSNHGGQSPGIPNVDLNDSPNVKQPKVARFKQEVIGLSNNTKPPVKKEDLIQLVNNIKNQKTFKQPNEEMQQSILNIDQYLLEDQDSYMSPALLDEVPDYIRQLSSKVNPQLHDALQQLQKQLTGKISKQLPPDSHYDERMLLDENVLSDQSFDKGTKIVVKRSPLQAKESGQQLTINKPEVPKQQQQQQFQLTPMRNPTSDSLAEEKMNNILKVKQQQPQPQMETIKESQEKPKVSEQKTLTLKKVKRVFEKLPQLNKVSEENTSWYCTLSLPLRKAFKERIQLTANSTEEYTVPIQEPPPKPKTEVGKTIKAEAIIIKEEPQYELPQSQIKPHSKPTTLPLQEEIKKQPEPKVVEAKVLSLPLSNKRVFEKLPIVNKQAQKQDQWFGTVKMPTKAKPFYDKVRYTVEYKSEKQHQFLDEEPIVNEQVPLLKLEDKQQRSPKITALKVKENIEQKPDPQVQQKVELQPQVPPVKQQIPKPNEQTAIPQESKHKQQSPLQKPQGQSVGQVESKPKEEKRPSIQNETTPKVMNQESKKTQQIKQQSDQKIDGKQSINLENIRVQAQKQWKREQEAIGPLETDQEITTMALLIPTTERKQVNKGNKSPTVNQEEAKSPSKVSPSMKKKPIVINTERDVRFTDSLRQAPKPRIVSKLDDLKQRNQPNQSVEPSVKVTADPINPIKRKLSLKQTGQQNNQSYLKLPPKEDKGNHSDTSPDRSQRTNDARNKLVKAIQLYEKLITRMDSDPDQQARLTNAMNDLKEQLKSMEAPPTLNNETKRKAPPSELKIHSNEPNLDKQQRGQPASVRNTNKTTKLLKSVSPESQINVTSRQQNNNKQQTVNILPTVQQLQLQLDPNLLQENQQKLQQNMTTEKPKHTYDEQALKVIDKLRDIFNHYSKQNLNLKMEYTFEDIKEDKDLLNLNKVIAFLQDFGIGVSPPKVAELFKKCALQSKVMQFVQFQEFLENLYMKQYDTKRENVKRKILSVNFKLKKCDNDEETEKLGKQKSALKKQLQELTMQGISINHIYKQLRDDLKIDDTNTFHSKMRGYIPEYDKLPKLPPTKLISGSKTTKNSPKRMEEELAVASAGVPKIPEFLQLQELIRKNKEQELQMREKLRDISRSQRKMIAMQSQAVQGNPVVTLETIKQRQGSKLQQQSILELIDMSQTPGLPSAIRSGSKLKGSIRQFDTGSPSQEKMVRFPELKTNRTSALGSYATSEAGSPKMMKSFKQNSSLLQI